MRLALVSLAVIALLASLLWVYDAREQTDRAYGAVRAALLHGAADPSVSRLDAREQALWTTLRTLPADEMDVRLADFDAPSMLWIEIQTKQTGTFVLEVVPDMPIPSIIGIHQSKLPH